MVQDHCIYTEDIYTTYLNVEINFSVVCGQCHVGCPATSLNCSHTQHWYQLLQAARCLC